jgi:hypothetical protein
MLDFLFKYKISPIITAAPIAAITKDIIIMEVVDIEDFGLSLASGSSVFFETVSATAGGGGTVGGGAICCGTSVCVDAVC